MTRIDLGRPATRAQPATQYCVAGWARRAPGTRTFNDHDHYKDFCFILCDSRKKSRSSLQRPSHIKPKIIDLATERGSYPVGKICIHSI